MSNRTEAKAKTKRSRIVGAKEVSAMIGVGLVAFGLWQIYAPLCPIFCGGTVLFLVSQSLPRPRREP